MTGLICSAAVAFALASQAPGAQPEPALASQAIVQELRALREAIEQVLATNVRVQLLLGRLQLQETRIQTLIRQSREIDSQIDGMASERDSLRQQQRTFERAATETTDPEEREFAKQQQTVLAERLKQLDSRHATLLADQANAQQVIANEQSRWGEFNSRLEELERMLGSVKR
jgi:hypothetical protein